MELACHGDPNGLRILAVQFAVQLVCFYVNGIQRMGSRPIGSFSQLCLRKLVQDDDELPSGKKES